MTRPDGEPVAVKTARRAAERLALTVNPQGPRESAEKWYWRVMQDHMLAVPLSMDE